MQTTIVTAVAGEYNGNWNGDSLLALEASIYPYSLLVSPGGSYLYMTNWATTERIQRIQLSPSGSSPLSPTPAPTAYPLGNIYSLRGCDVLSIYCM